MPIELELERELATLAKDAMRLEVVKARARKAGLLGIAR